MPTCIVLRILSYKGRSGNIRGGRIIADRSCYMYAHFTNFATLHLARICRVRYVRRWARARDPLSGIRMLNRASITFLERGRRPTRCIWALIFILSHFTPKTYRLLATPVLFHSRAFLCPFEPYERAQRPQSLPRNH